MSRSLYLHFIYLSGCSTLHRHTNTLPYASPCMRSRGINYSYMYMYCIIVILICMLCQESGCISDSGSRWSFLCVHWRESHGNWTCLCKWFIVWLVYIVCKGVVYKLQLSTLRFIQSSSAKKHTISCLCSAGSTNSDVIHWYNAGMQTS